MSIITVGIDLAKNVFAVHGVNETGKPELIKPRVARSQLLELFAKLPPCLIGMEACSRAHHWARLFQAHSHTVRLIAPRFGNTLSPLRQTRQERRGGRSSSLRSRHAPQHALRPRRGPTDPRS
jgi:transposase